MTLSLPQMACSDIMGMGHGAVRHMTQWALLVWSVTQVCVPGHTTLEQDSAVQEDTVAGFSVGDPGEHEISSFAIRHLLYQSHIREICIITATVECTEKEK